MIKFDENGIAKFDLTKSGYLKCLSARILDE